MAFKIVLFLFFFLYSCDCSKNKKQTVNFEIYRHKSSLEQFLNHGHEMGLEFEELFDKGKRDNDSIALYRFLDDEFYGEIIIGHPGQKLYVSFDTSWGLSWVLSSRCGTLRNIGCWFHRKYNHDSSSEYKKDGRPFAMNLGKYNMTGFYSYDNISIAHSNVTAQSFVEMVSVPRSFLLNKADGILGLGVKTTDYNPFFYNLLNQKKIKNPLFSIYLNRDRQSKRGGNIMLGFIDDKHIHKNRINNRTIPENFTYLPIDNSGYWQFRMDKIIVDMMKNPSFVLCPNGCDTLVDTSATHIIGPKEEVDQIHDKIEARELILDRYMVKCDTVNKLPKISFVLNGKNFTLAGPQYTVQMSYSSFTLCLSAFIPANTVQEQSRWILGGAFLAEYYSVYDVYNKKIGFVKAAK